MSWRASLAIVFFLFLFSPFCVSSEQPHPGSTAAIDGLRGPVRSVLIETFIYRDKGEKTPIKAERRIYDHAGYETEFYEYDSRGILLRQTVCTRNGSHLVKTETINLVSKEKTLQIYNSDGAVTETDTYNSNGVLSAKIVNDASLNTEKPNVSIMRSTDGSISTIERFADGSSKERTVKPDGTTVVHFHSRAGGWRQVTDANNRPLEYIEEPSTGEYRRMSTRYDNDGREVETATYDRSGKLLSETTFRYLNEDENRNWTEWQIWVKTNSISAKLYQVTRRTFTYFGNPLDNER